MSFSAINIVLKCPEVKSGERLLLLVLAHHANDEGKAWPGIGLLMRETNLGLRQTRRSLASLEKKGWLTSAPGEARGGGTLYRLNLNKLVAAGASSVTSASESMSGMSPHDDTGDTSYKEELKEELTPELKEEGEVCHSDSPTALIPSRKQALSYCAASGLDSTIAEKWWSACERRSWTDGTGRRINDWQGALAAYCRRAGTAQSDVTRGNHARSGFARGSDFEDRSRAHAEKYAPKNGF